MNDVSSPPAAWPAAKRSGLDAIQHPAWEEARNAVLDLAAAGPVTIALVGAPGTGKSWLLRELAGCLGDHGFPTMALMQGDLPMSLSDNAALVIDEALRMSDDKRAELLAQDRGVVVLGDGERLAEKAASATVIRLRALTPLEVPRFASEWLRRAKAAAVGIDADGAARLVARSGGSVQTIVELLGAASAKDGRLTAADIDRAAAVPEPKPVPVTPVPGLSAPRRAGYLWPVAGSAIAAGVLGWVYLQHRPPATPPPAEPMVEAPPPAPVPAQTAAAPLLPPLQDAEATPPPLVVAASPVQPDRATAVAISPPLPPKADLTPPSNGIAVSPPLSTSVPPLALIAQPSPDPVSFDPEMPAKIGEAPSVAPIPPAPLVPVLSQSMPRGGPGLVLVARSGDTLSQLYKSVYRGRAAPPFAAVAAANPHPLKSGAIVIFPEPPGGWKHGRR